MHLREGLRSYHANGYLVALNYPELTGERLLSGLSQLPIAMQLRVIQDLQASEHSLGHAVGSFFPQAVRQVIAAATSHQALLSRQIRPGAQENINMLFYTVFTLF